MSSFTATIDTSQEYGNTVLRKRVYRFDALLLFDNQSFGINGLDLLPRFLIRPTNLIHLLDFDPDGNSTSRGFTSNNLFNGFFVKNTGLTDSRLLFEFNELKTRNPFGFSGQRSYKLFAEKTFDPAYQQSLQALWNLAGEETTIEDHEYLDRTVLGKKIVTNYFDEFEEFITYDYLGNKSKNVTIT